MAVSLVLLMVENLVVSKVVAWVVPKADRRAESWVAD
jgi:hypothetical protein